MRPLTLLIRTAVLYSHLCFMSLTQLPYVTSQTFLHSLCLFLHPSLLHIHNIHTPSFYALFPSTLSQKMEERYQREGQERQTDEFMKPFILNTEGLIRSRRIGGWWAGEGRRVQGQGVQKSSSATNNTSMCLIFLPLSLSLPPLPSSSFSPPPCSSQDNDTLVFIDFRADRMRQIVEALGIKPQFDTDTIPKDLVSLLASYTLSLQPVHWVED